MNRELYNIYLEYIPKLITEVGKLDNGFNRKLSYPLLIDPFDNYWNQEKRIVFFGKETYGWWFDDKEKYFTKKYENEELIDQLLLKYSTFKLGANYPASPFWNFCHKAFRRITKNDSKTGFVWNNVIKVDENRKTPEWKVMKSIYTCYPDLILKELEILKPDIIIFLTGPTMDRYLQYIFKGSQFTTIEQRWLLRLKHDNLPYHSYRSYHPKYLRIRRRSEDIIERICSCIEE